MPELPDVETFKRYLDATSLHRHIVDVEVRNAYVVKNISARELRRKLVSRRFESSRRHGKHLFVRVGGDPWLRLHFGMTGSLRYFKSKEKMPLHTRVLFSFEKDFQLAFDDQRMFGEIGLINNVDEFLASRGLGADALAIDLARFRKLFANHQGAVKSALLNQRLLAGIGNIYADEILFRARLHPATQVSGRNEKAVVKLFRALHYILKTAIDARADADRMPRSWLLLHRRKGGRCPRCGRELRSATIGGRTAWFCAHCQKCS
jgi:formamidopyrimidine-DNA glycosylase